MITVRQMKAARGLLEWSQKDLAENVGISTTSIGNIECGKTKPKNSTQLKIISAFSQNGLEFIGNCGVILK